MGVGLVVIKKELDGEEFSNTYAFWREDGVAQLGDDDLIQIGANVPITDGNTSGTTVSPTFLHRVISFDRRLTHSTVNYTEVYVTDGTRNEVDPSNHFFTSALQFQGLWAGVDPVAGNITLLIQRVPQGFSNRKGRLFMRAALSENEVALGGARLIKWQSTTAQAAVVSRVQQAILASGLDEHISVSPSDTPALSIPHYVEQTNNEGETVRDLQGATPIAQLVASRPNGRQVQKGRKRKQTNA